MPLKQSFCYPLYKSDDISFDALFKDSAEIGYLATELWFRDENFDEIAATARSHGLAIASMCGHRSIEEGLNQAENHDRIEQELRNSLEFAVREGIRNLVCFSGNRQPGQTDDDAIEACAKGLRRVAPHAEKAGVRLNVELLNSKVNHPSYQCDHSAWGVRVCECVHSPAVKILYDIYHMQIMEGDVIRTIQKNIQWIGHFHTAGNPGRRDLDQHQELNYPAICRAIAVTGYKGYIAHEFSPKGNPIDALRSAFLVCSGSSSAVSENATQT